MDTETYGNLIVDVKTARGAIPIENALVTVKTVEKDGGDVISILHTGKNGMTPIIQLPSRPRALSETPGGSVKPYLVYSIETVMDGFHSVENINVPIFEGITSIQPVELLPLDSISKYPMSEIVYNESFAANL